MNLQTQLDIIAIDGPAGSGKSTTARLVAEKLGFTFLDTGAMYRAITLKALRYDVDLTNEAELVALAKRTKIQLTNQGKLRVILDGEDVSRQIRSEQVSENVPIVSAHSGIRTWMVNLQRQFGRQGKIVAEGRDVGTVVFPDARLKIFLVASLEERAKRRLRDLSASQDSTAVTRMVEEIKRRDSIDSSRKASPLKKASDAIEIDTTNLSIDEQVDRIISEWRRKISEDGLNSE